MTLKLKNANVLPLTYETITILGLEVPLTDRLPFGAQVALLDLQAKRDAGDLGNFEFLMRTFCLFTLRLPKSRQVQYEWLSRQDLEADEVTELTEGTVRLLNALSAPQAGDGEREGKSPNAPKGKGKKQS